MKIIFSLLAGITMSYTLLSQPIAEKQKILYGSCTKDSLTVAPFDKWFNTGYDSYQPNSEVISQLKKQNTKDITIQVFFGTWCGDSKREVPRFLKIANDAGISATNIKLIAVGASDSLYKQSPQQEHKGLGIFRVPTIIVYRNGTELNRINEYPSLSLERDLLAILSQTCTPNYRSFNTVTKWLNNGTLLDENISGRSIASQLKTLVGNEHELNSLGYLLLGQEKKKEALKLFQANYSLYPESVNVMSSLGEGYLKNGDNKNAIIYLERSLEQNKDPQAVKEILKLLYEAKGVK